MKRNITIVCLDCEQVTSVTLFKLQDETNYCPACASENIHTEGE